MGYRLANILLENGRGRLESWPSFEKRVYALVQELDKYDWLELPDGTVFTKTFSPRKREEI